MITVNSKKKQVTATDGKWYLIEEGWFNHECCDCSLEHRVDLKIVKGKIAISFNHIKSETEMMIEAGFPVCFPKSESKNGKHHCKTCIRNYKILLTNQVNNL